MALVIQIQKIAQNVSNPQYQYIKENATKMIMQYTNDTA